MRGIHYVYEACCASQANTAMFVQESCYDRLNLHRKSRFMIMNPLQGTFKVF